RGLSRRWHDGGGRQCAPFDRQECRHCSDQRVANHCRQDDLRPSLGRSGKRRTQRHPSHQRRFATPGTRLAQHSGAGAYLGKRADHGKLKSKQKQPSGAGKLLLLTALAAVSYDFLSLFMNIAIIAAAGAGTRMASDRPKQFLLLAGKPVIIHTLRVFEECESIDEVIVVLPAAESAGFLSLAGKFNLRKVARVVPGGATRADSVKRGLMAIRTATVEIVVVHDGVRPFVTVEEID